MPLLVLISIRREVAAMLDTQGRYPPRMMFGTSHSEHGITVTEYSPAETRAVIEECEAELATAHDLARFSVP